MGVVEPDDELLEDPSRLLLRQPPVRPVAQRVVEQVAPLRILHRYCQVRGGQEHLRPHAATASAHVLTHAGLALQQLLNALDTGDKLEQHQLGQLVVDAVGSH